MFCVFLPLSRTLYYFDRRFMYVNNVERGHKIFWFFLWPNVHIFDCDIYFFGLSFGSLIASCVFLSNSSELPSLLLRFFYFISRQNISGILT